MDPNPYPYPHLWTIWCLSGASWLRLRWWERRAGERTFAQISLSPQRNITPFSDVVFNRSRFRFTMQMVLSWSLYCKCIIKRSLVSYFAYPSFAFWARCYLFSWLVFFVLCLKRASGHICSYHELCDRKQRALQSSVFRYFFIEIPQDPVLSALALLFTDHRANERDLRSHRTAGLPCRHSSSLEYTLNSICISYQSILNFSKPQYTSVSGCNRR